MKRVILSLLLSFSMMGGLIANQNDATEFREIAKTEQVVSVQTLPVGAVPSPVNATQRPEQQFLRSGVDRMRTLMSEGSSWAHDKVSSIFGTARNIGSGVHHRYTAIAESVGSAWQRSFVGRHPRLTLALSSGAALVGLAYYGYDCVQLHDLILRLEGKDKNFLLTTGAGTSLYCWRLHADTMHQEAWASAHDMLAASDAVFNALCQDLSLAERSGELRLTDENGLTVLPSFEIVDGHRRPSPETLRVVSRMISRELVSLREIMDGLTALDVPFLARRQLFPVNRFGGWLSSRFVLDHLRICEQGEDATQVAGENLVDELAELSAAQLQELLQRWQRYLQTYTQVSRCFWRRSFSGNEQKRMYAYVLAAVRYARLSAFKAIVDPHAIDDSGHARGLAAQLSAIPAVGVMDAVPSRDNVEALRAGVNRVYVTLDAQWHGQRTDSQKLVMRLLQVIRLKLDSVVPLIVAPVDARVLLDVTRQNTIIEQMQSVGRDITELRALGVVH